MVLRWGTSIADICWNGSLFVAVTWQQDIMVSENGVDWTLRPAGVSEGFGAITWNGSCFVAVGTAGAIIRSENGLDWSSHPSGISQRLAAITWNGSQFVAVGEWGRCVISEDGISWSLEPIDNRAYFSGVVWTGTRFVAVSLSGNCFTSVDGVVWTERHADWALEFNGVAWNGYTLVAVDDDGEIYTSSEGINWEHQVTLAHGLDGVQWIGSAFLVTADGGVYYTSPDGINWTAESTGLTADLKTVCWTGSKLLMAGRGGTLLTRNCQGGGFGLQVSPLHPAQGLDPLVLEATAGSGGSIRTISWTNMSNGLSFANGESSILLDPAPTETTSYRVTARDDWSGAIGSAVATVLVPHHSVFYDYNGDSCNSIQDLWLLAHDWGNPMRDDPNGDGHVNILDLMYINTAEVIACNP